jgi:hypothetical protein
VRRWLGVLTLVCCGVLAACGSSGGSKSSGTSASSGANTSNTSTSSETKAASGSGSSSEFCAAAKAQVEELPQKLQSLAASSDSAAWLQYADDAEKNNQTLGRLAPAEIKGDYATLEQAPVAVIKAIRDANGNISQIRIGLTQITRISTSADFRAASGRWVAYLKDHCALTIPGT